MLAGWVGRYGFRMRRQFEEALANRIWTIEELRLRFGALEKLMATPEDQIFFRKNLMKVKHRFRKLATFESITTDLQNSSTNEMMIRLFNDAVSDQMETIIADRDA